METVHLLVRWVLATWLVLIGIIYAVASLGLTPQPPDKHWGYMGLAILCVKVGQLIATEKRYPF